MLAAMKCGRNSVGIEIDSEYCRMTAKRLLDENQNLFSSSSFEFANAPAETENGFVLREKPVAYKINRIRRKKLVSK